MTIWLINATKPNLHISISHVSTARDIWVDLGERLAHTNAPRIHELWRNLCLMQKQPEKSIIDYYTQFKNLVDELSELQTLPECSCGAAKVLTQVREEQWFHLFLKGFYSERYSHVKAIILNIDPLASLRCVLIKCKERNFVSSR